MGFYPVCPGSGQYALGTPLFKNMKIKLENGKTVTISAPDNSDENRYISSMTLNGQNLDRNYLTHDELNSGASVNFRMGAEPNVNRGVSADSRPYSFSKEISDKTNKKAGKKTNRK